MLNTDLRGWIVHPSVVAYDMFKNCCDREEDNEALTMRTFYRPVALRVDRPYPVMSQEQMSRIIWAGEFAAPPGEAAGWPNMDDVSPAAVPGPVVEENEEYEEVVAEVEPKDKCYWDFGPFDIKSKAFLLKPGNFIVQRPDIERNGKFVEMEIYLCLSLNNLQGFQGNANQPRYDCSGVSYVKIEGYFVEKPHWFWAGPVPEPRKFKLVKTREKKYIGNSIHCANKVQHDAYQLTTIVDNTNMGGSRNHKKKRRYIKKSTIKLKKHIKKARKTKKYKQLKKIRSKKN
jgi:hypothetical protein